MPKQDYNCYFVSGANAVFEDRRPESTFSGNLAGWKSHISGDEHSMEADPALQSDYSLSAGSPCVDAGINLPEVSYDINRELRTGKYDIGAFEYRYGEDHESPTGPTNLKASAVSSSRIDLSWSPSTDNIGVAGYRIFRDGTGIGTTAGVSFSDMGLSPSRTYVYQVLGYDQAGNESALSDPASATTAPEDGGVCSFPMDFETALAPGFAINPVGGDATPRCVINESAPVGLAHRAIQTTQQWTVTFRWGVSGGTSDLLGPGSRWDVSVFLVCLSGGANQSRTLAVPYAVGAGSDDYTPVVTFAAGAVPVGVYKLYTSVDLRTGGVAPITLFGEGPLMKLYTA